VIATLLAVVGLLLLTIIGALVAVLWSRREFKRAPDTFPAKVRVIAGVVAGLGDQWPRRPRRARWVHDVLVMRRGLAWVRIDALGVARATGSLTAVDPHRVRGLGAQPIALTLGLDGGTSVQLAAPRDARNIMVGPFVGVLLVEDSKTPFASTRRKKSWPKSTS
jgi:hypothetical protein